MNEKFTKANKGCVLAVLVFSTSSCTVIQISEPDFSPALPEIVIADDTQTGSIYKEANNRFFFEDIRARRVGDVINVVLDERTNASKTASTNTTKDSSIDLPSPTIFGGLVSAFDTDIASTTDFAGSGDSSQSNQLTGSIAVVVAEVLSNGNMRIKGQKKLTLNQGSEIVRVSGLIRAVDITPDNTVLSNQIADANITYGGRGSLADANRAGWLTRVFNSAIWPF